MRKERFKQDSSRKMENSKEQFSLVPRGDSSVKIVGDTMYFCQPNCLRTHTFARGSNTWIK